MKVSRNKYLRVFFFPFLPLFLTYLRLPNVLGGDTGQWFEVALQMNRGMSLYTQIYDNKDLGFFYLLKLAFAIVRNFTIPFVYVICWLLIIRFLRPNTRTSGLSGIVIGTLCLYSQFGAKDALPAVVATSIYLLSFRLLDRNKVGGVIPLMLLPFIKLQFFVFIPMMLIWKRAEIKGSVSQHKKNFFISIFLVIGSFLSQHVIVANWLSVIKENYEYSQNSPRLIFNENQHMNIFIEQIFNNRLLFFTLTLYLASLLLLISNKKHFENAKFIYILALNLAGWVLILNTYLWPHHIANLLIPTIVNYKCAQRIFEKIDFKIDKLIIETKLFKLIGIVFCMMICIVWISPTSHNRIGAMSFNKDFIDVSEFPKSWKVARQGQEEYSYIGRSETGPFPGIFMPPDSSLTCPDTFLFSFFSARANRQLACAIQSQVIFISEKSIGDYLFRTKVPEKQKAIRNHLITLNSYQKLDSTWYGWSLLVKKNQARQ